MPKFIATADGFYNGARRRAGSTFAAHAGFKAKWATPAPAESEPQGKVVSRKGTAPLPGSAANLAARNIAPVSDRKPDVDPNDAI